MRQALPDRQWGEIGRNGRPLTTNKLARLLKDYDIKPQQRRIGNDNVKGYARANFKDASDRYLPPPSQDASDPTETPKQLSSDAGLDDNTIETGLPDVSVGGRPNPPDSHTCFDVSEAGGGVITDEHEEFVI